MAKLKGKKKAAFLRRMAAGRRKAAKGVKRVTKKIRKSRSRKPKSAPKRRKSQRRNTTKRRKNNVAKRRSTRKRISSGFTKITGNKFVRGAVLGLGGGAIATQVTNRFAPQFSGIAGPVGAFVFGGPIGLVASLFLQGGLSGVFGGGSNNQMVDSV